MSDVLDRILAKKREEVAAGRARTPIARSYEAGGAACLSVLTDEPRFKGHNACLAQARDACGLPAQREMFALESASH